jgi:hypothetical protein
MSRDYRTLKPNRVVIAMEKADPTCRVSIDYDARGRVKFVKRPKTEQELEMERMIAELTTNMQKKAESILEHAKAYDRAKGALEKNKQVLCPTCDQPPSGGPVCSNPIHLEV